jgi:hypothetical protein
MTPIQRNLLLGIGLATLVGVGGYYLLSGGSGFLPGTTSPTGTTTSVGGSLNASGDYTVELVGIQPPALSPIKITTDLSPEARTILRQKMDAQYAILADEPNRVDVWLLLGVNRKIGGDYQGAIEAWEYVAAVAPLPMVATARGNLGDLYMYFIKDYVKAKDHLTAAITAGPQVIEPYRALFYLEKDINKDPVAARAVVDLGLKNNPKHPDLLHLQSLL